MRTFQVKVEQIGKDEIAMRRALRVFGRLPLATVDRLYAFLTESPAVVVAGVEQPVAEHVASELRRAGARASVEPSSVPAPMVLEPKARTLYEWGSLKTLRKKRD
jgi:hypothetical protein